MAELYSCDPKKNTACKKTQCYINGGACYLTTEKKFEVGEKKKSSKKKVNKDEQ